jgi:hypothetical protein
MIFYLLHQLFNFFQVDTDHEGNVDHGKRNSKLFLLGTFLWIVIFVLLQNYRMGYFGPNKPYANALMTGTTLVLFIDLVYISYVYKTYFGKSVLGEVNDKLK